MPLDIGGFQITAGMENNLLYVPTVTSMVTSGLIMYLDAGNTSSYPGSGTSWADLSGNGRNATLINGPVFSSANGGSIYFDGTNDYADITYPTFSLGDFTMIAWIRGSGMFMGSGVQEAFPRRWWFNHSYFAFRPAQIWGNNDVPTFSLGGSSTTEWMMVTYMRRGSTMYGYRNANLQNTQGSFSTAALQTYTNWGQYLGKVRLDTTQYLTQFFFTGNIGSIAMYNRALASPEITQNYNLQKARFGL